MSKQIKRNSIVAKMNNISNAITEISDFDFILRKTNLGEKIHVSRMGIEKNIEKFIKDLVESLHLKEKSYLQNCIENKSMVITQFENVLRLGDIPDNTIMSQSISYLDYKENLESFEKLINDSFIGITSKISKEQIVLTIDETKVTFTRKITNSMLKGIHSGDINSVLTIIYNDIEKKTNKNVNKYLKIGITEALILSTIIKVQSQLSHSFKEIIKEINPLITDEVKEIWATENFEIYDSLKILKNLQILKKTSKRSIIVEKSIFTLRATNTFVTAECDTLKKNSNPIITINEDILQEIRNTINFLTTNEYIADVSRFINDFNKIKNGYLVQANKLYTKYKMEYLIDQKTLTNNLLINSYNFNEKQLIINKNIKISFSSLKIDYDSKLAVLNNEVKRLISELKQNCLNEKDKIKIVSKDLESQYILGIVNEFSKKGISTYINILHGDNTSNTRGNDYNKSSFYGKLNHLKKTAIEIKFTILVNSGFIEKHLLTARFGDYIGYIASNKFATEKTIEICEKITDSNVSIVTYPDLDIKEFIINIKKFSDISAFIENTKIMKFVHSDVSLLIDFIKNERTVYRDNEEIFVEKISKIIPSKYSPLFLMNSNLEKGVISKTFKNISIQLKEGEVH